MPASTLSSLTVPQNYAKPRREVELSLLTGQQAAERARVRTYWDADFEAALEHFAAMEDYLKS